MRWGRRRGHKGDNTAAQKGPACAFELNAAWWVTALLRLTPLLLNPRSRQTVGFGSKALAGSICG